MSDAPDPASLAAAASGGDPDVGNPVGSPGGDGTDPSPDRDGGGPTVRSRLIGALMETEPDLSPAEDYPDLPDYTAHFVIGLRKVANHLMGGGLGDGTPAVENFGRAAFGFVGANA